MELGHLWKVNMQYKLRSRDLGNLQRFKIILEKGLANVKTESDALLAVNLINEDPKANHPLSTIIKDARTILMGTASSLTHIYRRANECADHLARVGAEQAEDFKILMNNPLSVREFLFRDNLSIRLYLD